MAGELRQKQFITEEVEPAIRKTIPSMLDRLVALEEAISELSKPQTKPQVSKEVVSKAIIPKAKK